MRPARVFYGWYVVGCAFLVALWGWGLGFYGPSIYLVALQQEHAWSTATVSVAIIVLGRASARDRLEALPNPVGGGEMST